MLEVKQLSVSFGAVQALDSVSLVVPRGEVTAVIGANGAGKSTLMRTLAGLVKPQSGSAELDGVRVTGRAPEDIVRSGMALIRRSPNSPSRRTCIWADSGVRARSARQPRPRSMTCFPCWPSVGACVPTPSVAVSVSNWRSVAH